MNDYEAFKWLLDHFKNHPQTFEDSHAWEELERISQRYKKAYPDSQYIELLERYQRALFELAGIDYIINVKKGV